MPKEPCANMECVEKDELTKLKQQLDDLLDTTLEQRGQIASLTTERDELKAELEQVRPELDRVIDLGDRLEAAEQTIAHLKSVIEDACHVRPVVLWFACEMERQLKANDRKGGWSDCTDGYLLAKLDEEVGEVKEAVQAVHDDLAYKAMSFGERGDRGGLAGLIERVINEAADVANIAMMVADNARPRKAGEGK
jgi:regulator of replication initiation timing